MTNIPTDLLRTFVLVVELRSFTRAAKAQDMTQPAVSAQIRRLQGLLGVELFDKSAPGICLTAMGEQALDAARRMLSVNDHLLQVARSVPATQNMRIGVPGDCMGAELARVLSASHTRWPNLRFSVQDGGLWGLLQGLKQAEIELVVARYFEKPDYAPRYSWPEDLVWARAKSTLLDPAAPVPIVSYRIDSVLYRVGVMALKDAGRAAELVFRGTNAAALHSAVAAGLGVLVVPRRRVPAGLEIWDDGSLPALPQVYCGIFVRECGGNNAIDQIADHLRQTMRPAAEGPAMAGAPLVGAAAAPVR